jgi:hypothetical protein
MQTLVVRMFYYSSEWFQLHLVSIKHLHLSGWNHRRKLTLLIRTREGEGEQGNLFSHLHLLRRENLGSIPEPGSPSWPAPSTAGKEGGECHPEGIRRRSVIQANAPVTWRKPRICIESSLLDFAEPTRKWAKRLQGRTGYQTGATSSRFF